jgi:hypothetical protein
MELKFYWGEISFNDAFRFANSPQMQGVQYKCKPLGINVKFSKLLFFHADLAEVRYNVSFNVGKLDRFY